MRSRFVAGLGALVLTGNALFGVGWSGATWSTGTTTALAVVAADDWTPPSVTVSPLASTVQGTVAVTATSMVTLPTVRMMSGSTSTATGPATPKERP